MQSIDDTFDSLKRSEYREVHDALEYKYPYQEWMCVIYRNEILALLTEFGWTWPDLIEEWGSHQRAYDGDI